MNDTVKNNTINVLDKGFVRLIDYMGSDLAIVRSARVSYDADWREGDDKKDAKLLAYLMKNKHTSPLESVVFTFEVKAPLFIFRQWQRHRTWSYNEISARYTELDEGFYIPSLDKITSQSKDSKQARTNEQLEQAEEAQTRIRIACEEAFATYKGLLGLGVARELARSVLPVAAYSRMFASVDLHNLLHFIRLRIHPHAQWEIQQYALALLELITPVVPVTIEGFKKSLEEENGN